MPTVRMAARGVEPVVLRFGGRARAAVQELRDRLEYLRHERALPRVRASVAMDIVPALSAVVVARGLVPGDAPMTAFIRDLPPISIAGHQSSGSGTPDHPMRIATRRAAGLDPGGWTGELRTEVAGFFDGLADEWHTRTSPQRTAVVKDALTRGVDAMRTVDGVVVEIGSGTGAYSQLLADRFAIAIAVDLTHAMLIRAPAGPAHRVQADAARLPLRDRAAAAVVLINAFLFPAEVDRVLTPDGLVVWVNSSGPHTPIHLSADEVVAALGGAWTGVASQAGEGTWCVLRRR